MRVNEAFFPDCRRAQWNPEPDTHTYPQEHSTRYLFQNGLGGSAYWFSHFLADAVLIGVTLILLFLGVLQLPASPEVPLFDLLRENCLFHIGGAGGVNYWFLVAFYVWVCSVCLMFYLSPLRAEFLNTQRSWSMSVSDQRLVLRIGVWLLVKTIKLLMGVLNALGQGVVWGVQGVGKGIGWVVCRCGREVFSSGSFSSNGARGKESTGINEQEGGQKTLTDEGGPIISSEGEPGLSKDAEMLSQEAAEDLAETNLESAEVKKDPALEPTPVPTGTELENKSPLPNTGPADPGDPPPRRARQNRSFLTSNLSETSVFVLLLATLVGVLWSSATFQFTIPSFNMLDREKAKDLQATLARGLVVG